MHFGTVFSHSCLRIGLDREAVTRQPMTATVFVLKTGIQWENLPHEVFGACGMTCWRRMREWQAAGVWRELQRLLLNEHAAAGRID
jgi:transposase